MPAAFVLSIQLLHLYITYRFFRVFFPKKNAGPFMGILLYAIYYLAAAAVYSRWKQSLCNLLIHFVLLCLLSLWYTASWRKRLLCVSLACGMMVSATTCALSLIFHLSGGLSTPELRSLAFQASIITAELLDFLFVLILERVKDFRVTYAICTKDWFYLMLVPLGNAFLAFTLLGSNLPPPYLIACSLVLAIMTGLVFHLYRRLLQTAAQNQERLVLRHQVASYELQNKNFRENQTRLMSLKHDMKNHVLYILQCIRRGHMAEADNYCTKLLGDLTEVLWLIDTGNHPLDAILNCKLAQAKEASIRVHTEIRLPPDLPLDPVDCNIIFGNLLDNAIEACAYLDESERVINLNLEAARGILTAVVENTCRNPKSEEKGACISLKRAEEGHGLGLKNVRRAVEQNQGQLLISQEQGRFICQLLLYLP